MGKYNRAIKITLIAAAALACAVLLPPLALLAAFLVLVRALAGGEAEPVRDPVSSGSCEVAPAALTAGGAPSPVTVTYVVGEGGIAEGGSVRLCPGTVLRYGPSAWQLRLQWGSGWGNLQRKNPSKANHLQVRASRDDVELSVSMMEKAMDRTQLMWLKRKMLQKLGFELPPLDPRDVFMANHKVTVRLERGSLVQGDSIEFEIGAEKGLRPPLVAVPTEFAFEVDGAGTGSFELERSTAVLEAVGGRPARFDVVAPTLAAPGEEIRVLVRCLDENGVITPEYAGALQVNAHGPVEAPQSAIMAESAGGLAWFVARVRGCGVARVHVRSPVGGIEGTSNPVVCRTTRARLLWGDLHTHSIISDGTQEPGYMYHRARNLLGWDFTGVADHDNWSLGEERAKTPEELSLMTRAADEAYVPGEFVTFRTYEWSHHVRGHRNVLFGPGETPVFLPFTDPRSDTPAGLMSALAGKDALVIPHHPAWKTHFGEMRFDYGPRDERSGPGGDLQRLAEVYSRHGNSEFHGCPRPVSHVGLMKGARGKAFRAVLRKEYAGQKSGSYVRDALAAGYRLGLTAGSDEHIAGSDPSRAPTQIYGGGTTGIFAPARTREAAWEGLRARRVVATTGNRMLLEFSINGEPHGSEIDSDGSVHIAGHVVGTSPLELVELVKYDSNGYRDVWQGGGSTEVVVDWKDPSFRENSFYYLRAVQDDGNLGWAGPTWVDYLPLGRI